jgi:hypothetical protein
VLPETAVAVLAILRVRLKPGKRVSRIDDCSIKNASTLGFDDVGITF